MFVIHGARAFDRELETTVLRFLRQAANRVLATVWQSGLPVGILTNTGTEN
jgi:hypothetical protein